MCLASLIDSLENEKRPHNLFVIVIQKVIEKKLLYISCFSTHNKNLQLSIYLNYRLLEV